MTENSDRPLITFALIAYNQERFIAEAVEGAFSQTYSPLEIILSDDCSPDRTFEIMQTMTTEYQGSHTIVLNRNEKNLGLVGHINRVMEMVKGELTVIAAGDDISKPRRTESIYQNFLESDGTAFSIFSTQWEVIDEQGNQIGERTYELPKTNELDLMYFGKTRRFIPGHSHAWHKSVFDVFGPISTDVVSEDIVIPFRAALLGKVHPIHETLVIRRHHSTNLGGPRTALTYRAKIEWYKEHHTTLIKNRIGIAETFLADIQIAKHIRPDIASELDGLTKLNEKYLISNCLEMECLNADILTRFHILIKGIVKYKLPVLRSILWLFGHHSFAILTFFPINLLGKFYQNYIKPRF